MTRVKRGNVARKRRKKVLKLTQGFRGSSSTLFRTANQRKLKALQYSYRDRLQRKREFRSLWISRLSAAVRLYGINYSEFIHILKVSKIFLNRKILAQLAIRDKKTFEQLLELIVPNYGH
jgi:large subunit ribosomal protein L20|uniref:Large ribosomal subunit protein bL20c n=1 Tax=Parietochloris pseudoalveolaris TaxID=3102 RepID=A0A097KLG2_9CHLO|nr:ribosomal protein L20 [Parietochloris pseudoalveolaris]AIT94040.1 ribosomal protein L20 [Parietochloris pseudoalveolaris]